MAVEMHSAETLYDTAKIISKTCLEKYDSYFTTVGFNPNDTALNGQFEILCGNLDISSGTPTFQGYERHVIGVDNKTLPTSVIYIQQNKTDKKQLTVSTSNQYFYYTNIKQLKKPDYLKLEEKTESPGTPGGGESGNTSPIDKNDFYLIPVLLCILILMLFLKWCFPMKGGKSL